jgi:nucleotide-binding universal stress UspA family protein
MKMLVPVDGSEHSANAAAWAAQRAAESGGSVTLLHVYSMPSTDAMGLANLSREEIEEAKQLTAAPSFDKARQAVADTNMIQDACVSIGEPDEEIIAFARARGFDHIVMGSRGLSPIKELLLGSVSERVLREAPCAVTIIR